jgi:hypothetical protein
LINNVLILGAGSTSDQFIEWFTKHNIRFLSICDEPGDTRHWKEFADLRKQSRVFRGPTHLIDPDIFYGPFLQSWIDAQQFHPEWIINCHDQKSFLEVEYELGKAYQTNNALTEQCVQFFTFKSIQDEVCKQLEIPTLPKYHDAGLCVKRDFKPTNHETHIIPKFRWESHHYTPKADEFAQAWCDFDAIFNLHVAVDVRGRWTLVECAKLEIERSMVIHEWSPWAPTTDELNQIESILVKLKHALPFNCRVCLYQLARCKDDSTLYNLDWNSRLGGDNILKLLGKEVGSFDLISSVFDQSALLNSLHYENSYRGDTIWYHRANRLQTQNVMKSRAWWEDPTVAWTWNIGSAEHQTLKLTKL